MTKEEWLKKYKQYFLDNGCDEKVAQDATDAADCDYYDLETDDPEDCAAEEMSYWDE